MSKIILFLLVLVSSIAYFGLAVLGEGGIQPFLDSPPLLTVIAISLLMVAAGMAANANISPGEREDRSNRWVLYTLMILGFVDGYVPAWSDRADWFTVDGDTVRWIGAALYTVGGVLRLWPVFVLGRRFSGLVAIQKGHTLVTDGIYTRVRNPSYLGLLTMTLGWGLAFRSLPGVAIALLMVPPIVARMNSEEAMLGSQFGAEYEAYRSRTWRLVPFVY